MNLNHWRSFFKTQSTNQLRYFFARSHWGPERLVAAGIDRERNCVSNLQSCIDQNDFFLGDAANSKAPFEHIATLHVEQVLVALLLKHGRIVIETFPADDSNIAVIWLWRRRDGKHRRKRIDLAIVITDHHHAGAGIRNHGRGHGSSARWRVE